MLALVVPAGAFTSEQATRGAEIFRLQCARCHGPDGQGKDAAWRGLRAPELVGPQALPVDPRPYQQIRRRPFRSARDVYDFASAAMPADQPASLDARDYFAVLAYVLATNGAAADARALDDTSSRDVALRRGPRGGGATAGAGAP